MAARMSWEDAKERLKQWREENDRRSEEIVDLWLAVVNKNVNRLGDEKWVVYEQVCTAALDCHRMALATECLTRLKEEFPGSSRVRKLEAMHLEALERYDKASSGYDKLLAEDEASAVLHKRKVAVLLAQNQVPEAIRDLSEYLKKFMGDQEAWLQLSHLYIQEQDLPKAAFCLEELILCNPHNHLYYQRYAEIQYTVGTFDSMELARSYFAQAVKLNPNNIRALYGFFMAASHIASLPKCSVQKKKDNQRYAAWASQQITKKYQERLNETSRSGENSQVKLLEGMLSSLLIN